MLQQAASTERVASANMAVLPPYSDDNDMREWHLLAWQYFLPAAMTMIWKSGICWHGSTSSLQQWQWYERAAPSGMAVLPPCSNDNDMREWHLLAWQYTLPAAMTMISESGICRRGSTPSLQQCQWYELFTAVAELSSCPVWSVRAVLELSWVIPLWRHLFAVRLRCIACTCNWRN